MSIKEKLKQLGIVLRQTPKPLGSYKPCVISGELIYVSGQLPIIDGDLKYKGKVDAEVSLEEGIDAARISAVNSLSVLNTELGSLELVERVVKVTGYVASSEGFYNQANVVNGASDLYFEIFGETGLHARAAVGVYQLPLNSPVEIEVIVQYKKN